MKPICTKMTEKKIYVYGGGTFVHVRPHFSIAAPAYGSAASNIQTALSKRVRAFPLENFRVIHVPTKMAQKDSLIETNTDLFNHVSGILKDPETACIVMSAAICDFNVESLSFHEEDDYDIGKQYNRLDSSMPFGMYLCPSRKIIRDIKRLRPDVKLVSFKTTSGEDLDYLRHKTLVSMKDAGSDIVFGNDIKNKLNIIRLSKHAHIDYPDRYMALMELCKYIVNELTEY